MNASSNNPLPERFSTLQEFWGFWDSHSSADYENQMEDAADLEISLDSSKVYCAVSKKLAMELRSQARRQGMSTETLINKWLTEKVSEATSAG